MSEIDYSAILEWPEMKDVKDELEDPRYGTRKHGSRATRALGCDGVLCRLAETLRGRKRNEDRARRAGRVYRPSNHRKYDREDLLIAIIAWHEEELTKRRKEAS